MKQRLIVLTLALLLPARNAYAYVDPGILSILYQAIYVLVFGAAATFIFKPWNYLKSVFKKDKLDAQAVRDQDMDNPN